MGQCSKTGNIPHDTACNTAESTRQAAVAAAAMSPAGQALKRAGWIRLALGYFFALLLAMFGADAIFGDHGLGWFHTRSTAGAIGVAFVVIWAYLTFIRLSRLLAGYCMSR